MRHGFLVLIALSSFLTSAGYACFCREQELASACAGRGGDLFFTGVVVRDESSGRSHRIEVRVIRNVRGAGQETIWLDAGPIDVRPGVHNSCDPHVEPLQTNQFVQVITERPRLDSCSRVIVLPNRDAATRDPCR